MTRKKIVKMRAGEYTLEVMRRAGWYNKWLFSLIEKYLHGNILEVGAGIGNFTNLLASRGTVTAIDIDKKYLANFNKGIKNFRSGFGDIEEGSYFFKREKFNTIVCLNVLEHIRNDGQALKNMVELLKEGGFLILLVPAHQYLFSNFDTNLGHYRRYSKMGLKDKLDGSGLMIHDLKYINYLAAIGWLVYMKIFKFKIMPDNPVGFFDKLGRLFLLPEKLINPPFGLSVLLIAKK